MSAKIISVQNHENLFKLIDRWSRDQNSRPSDVSNFIGQANDAAIDAGVAFPARVPLDTPIRFEILDITANTTEIILTIPKAELIDEAMDEFSGPDASRKYVIPHFYDDLFRDSTKRKLGKADRMKTAKARIAEYCVGVCM